MQIDAPANESDASDSGDYGDYDDRPSELKLSMDNPIVLGMRTTLLTPSLCMTVDSKFLKGLSRLMKFLASSQKFNGLYNQPTGITPIITTKIIFSPTSLGGLPGTPSAQVGAVPVGQNRS